jgi:hypothetical protein
LKYESVFFSDLMSRRLTLNEACDEAKAAWQAGDRYAALRLFYIARDMARKDRLSIVQKKDGTVEVFYPTGIKRRELQQRLPLNDPRLEEATVPPTLDAGEDLMEVSS